VSVIGQGATRNAAIVGGFAKTQLLRHLAYPGDFWIAPIARLGIAFALIGFWNAVVSAGAAPGGMSKEMLLAWAGAAVVVSRLVSVDLAEDVAERIRRGDIVFEVMRPADFQPQALGTWLGRTGHTLLVDTLPIAVVLWGIARIQGPPDLIALGLALVSLLVAMLTAFLLQFTVILIGFWTIQVRTWTWLLASIIQLAGGWFVPLWLLPEGIRNVLQYLPFAMLYHVPLSTFVGRLPGLEAAQMIAIQLAWLPVLLVVSRWMMREARRRVLIQGG
jgi:ABC-2 type transport system permease protein